MNVADLEQLIGESTYDEWNILPSHTVNVVPLVTIGDGLAGPPNAQPLQIFRDERPIASDELGRGHLTAVAHIRAGRTFPLYEGYGAGLDLGMPGRAAEMDQSRFNGPLGPWQDTDLHEGVPAPELIRNARTVFWTATPQAGWEGW